MKIKVHLLTLAALLFIGLPLASSSAFVAVSVSVAPPVIPVYEQPVCPTPGYIWTPGYWAYADSGYYWVPGVWVAPPRVGFLWTPGYWGYSGSNYIFHQGYWGPTVGFYGGINYGYGYTGSGYYGGRWDHGSFRYNTAVSRVNTSFIHNTYVDRTVIRNNNARRVSFNGPGGVQARPTRQQEAAAKARHVAPTRAQIARANAAKSDPSLHAASNKGKPNTAAVRSFEGKNRPAAKANAANNKSNAAKAGRQQTVNNNKNAAKRTAAEERAKTNNETKAKAARSAEANQSRKAAQTRKTAEMHRAAETHHAAQPVRHAAGNAPRAQHKEITQRRTRRMAPARPVRHAQPQQRPNKKKKGEEHPGQ
ncbi:MAG TPA: hypothetical protein VHW03_10155 [Chthoniobacterales bacterium]|nr:hypothetical protein [Chthoniobacterales bacterium]